MLKPDQYYKIEGEKMKRCMFFAVLFLFSACFPVYGQGNTAVLFDGTSLRGSFRPLSDNSDLSSVTSSKFVFPGVEVRFNQNGRVTVGTGYQNWRLSTASETYFLDFCPKGKFCPLPGNPNPGTGEFITHHPQTGEPLASVTEDSLIDGHLVSSTIYVNILKKGRVRPFVAGGGGMAFLKQTFRTTALVHPNIEEVIGHQFKIDVPESRQENFKKLTVKGVAGVNVFPVSHTVVFLSGGYHNGTVLNFGFGFTF